MESSRPPAPATPCSTAPRRARDRRPQRLRRRHRADQDEPVALPLRRLSGVPPPRARFPRDYTAEDLRADYDLAQAQALLYSAASDHRGGAGRLQARRPLRAPGPPPPPDRAAPAAAIGSSSTARTRSSAARAPTGSTSPASWPPSCASGLAPHAEIELRKGWRPLTFALSAADGLGARVPAPPEFDSALEAAIARKFGRERDGWRLRREGDGPRGGRRGCSSPTSSSATRTAPRSRWRSSATGLRSTSPTSSASSRRVRAREPPRRGAAAPGRPAGALPATVLPFNARILLRDLLPHLEAFRRSPRQER